MKNKRSHVLKIGLITVIFMIALNLFMTHFKNDGTLYQVSVLNGLMNGDYDGKVTLGEIRKHGDFGIGTFDRLDGESIELDGIFYHVGSDGVVRKMPLSATAPFAMSVFFKTDVKFKAGKYPDFQSLQGFIDSHLPTKNFPYAVRVEGKFSNIKVRSVPAQDKPYPLITEVTKKQSVFDLRDIEGTLVGFRMPDYLDKANVPGYHMHFLSRDKAKGGHVLGCVIDSGEVSIEKIENFEMVLKSSDEFDGLDFSKNTDAFHAAEKSK